MTEIVLALVRHLMTFGGGYLTSKNLASADEVGALAGALITVVGIGLSIAQKVRASRTLDTADRLMSAAIQRNASRGSPALPNPPNPNLN